MMQIWDKCNVDKVQNPTELHVFWDFPPSVVVQNVLQLTRKQLHHDRWYAKSFARYVASIHNSLNAGIFDCLCFFCCPLWKNSKKHKDVSSCILYRGYKVNMWHPVRCNSKPLTRSREAAVACPCLRSKQGGWFFSIAVPQTSHHMFRWRSVFPGWSRSSAGSTVVIPRKVDIAEEYDEILYLNELPMLDSFFLNWKFWLCVILLD